MFRHFFLKAPQRPYVRLLVFHHNKIYYSHGQYILEKSGYIVYHRSKRQDLLKILRTYFYTNGKYHRLRTKKRLCVFYFARILQKLQKKEDKTDRWWNHMRLLKRRMSSYKKTSRR
jgi:hypothetical protein